jgi:hypothetical protein
MALPKAARFRSSQPSAARQGVLRVPTGAIRLNTAALSEAVTVPYHSEMPFSRAILNQTLPRKRHGR